MFSLTSAESAEGALAEFQMLEESLPPVAKRNVCGISSEETANLTIHLLQPPIELLLWKTGSISKSNKIVPE